LCVDGMIARGWHGAMHPLSRKFGEVLRRRRESAGLSQETLAGLAGIHRNHVGLIERGQRVPSILVASQLAKAMGTKMSELMAEVEEEGDD
jgi:transcriptional regulator with XRE-family HTH domain